MSATNRWSERRPYDEYLTPSHCVRRFLEAYKIPSGVCLDPCAARGELLSVVKEMRPDCIPVGFELRSECLPDLQKVTEGRAECVDFLALAPSEGAACVLTNFPFSLAEEFLRHSLKFAPIVITLQRLNWIRGNGRHRLMAELRPGLFVLPERPSFTGGGTDATEYCWWVFGDQVVAGTWTMLGETSSEERAAWNAKAREAAAAEPVAPDPLDRGFSTFCNDEGDPRESGTRPHDQRVDEFRRHL